MENAMTENNQYLNNSHLNESFLSKRGNDIMSMNPNNNYIMRRNNQGNNNIQMNYNHQQNYPINDKGQLQSDNNWNFNQNMNGIVRNAIKSRGIVLTEGNNYNNSPYHNKDYNEGNERKKMLLNNIQQQITLTKNSKMIELEKKRKEEEKYVQDMQNFYPFGRGGAGAPIRDKFGNAVTSRRALISDPRYQHVAINIDDDFEEAMQNNKQLGLVNFINKSIQPLDNRNFNQPLQSGMKRSHSSYNRANIDNNMNFNMNPNMNQNLNMTYSNDNNMNYNNYNQPNVDDYVNSNNNMNYNYMNNPDTMNQNYNQNNNQYYNQNYNQNNTSYLDQNTNNNQNINNNQNPNNNQNFQNYQPPHIPTSSANLGLSISYKNTELDSDSKRNNKSEYGNILRLQMEQDKLKKDQEKDRKKREEIEEEMRVRREMDILKMQEEKERDKKKNDLDKLNNENLAIRENYVISKKRKGESEENKDQNNFNNMNKNNSNNNVTNYDYNTDQNYNNNQNQNYNNNQNNLDQNGTNQDDIELRQNINNEILNLRNNFVDQQNVLLKQINDLKTETQNANLQRYEVLKEFNVLKEELSKQRVDEEMRRKYVYDVLVDNNNKVGDLYSNSKLPELNQEEYRVELPKQRNHNKNYKNIYYDDTIKHPNRVQAVPRLGELKENQMRTSSKFIDVDTHNVLNDLNIYEPVRKDEELEKIKGRGFELDEDFGPLRSYYKEKKTYKDNADQYFYSQKNKYENIGNEEKNIQKTPNYEKSGNLYSDKEDNNFNTYVDVNIEHNKKVLNDTNLSINQIYNKNLERLRYLNNIEDNYNEVGFKFDNKTNTNNFKNEDNKYDNYDTNNITDQDDFLSKLNNIKYKDY